MIQNPTNNLSTFFAAVNAHFAHLSAASFFIFIWLSPNHPSPQKHLGTMTPALPTIFLLSNFQESTNLHF
jgi:hypothetical protein